MTKERNPTVQLLILVGLAVGALFIFQFFSLIILMPFSDLGLEDFVAAIANPYAYPEMRWNLIWMQGITSLGAFIVAPVYFIYKHDHSEIEAYIPLRKIPIIAVMLAVFVTLAFMIVNGIFIEWNLEFQFPGGFHDWASEKEELLRLLTEYLTVFDSSGYFIITFLVIAVIPAFGEELLFRGLIQKYVEKISGNVHVAIWLTAFFFSAFHLQFFGFVPRLLLGAFFGYLFYFSGNLWYAIIAHFVNNGFTLIMIYLYQKGAIVYDIENTEPVPLDTVAIFFIIGAILMVLFYKQFEKSNNMVSDQGGKGDYG